MPTIILHAGMPKAGSSTIQRWTRKNLDFLRDELGIELVVFRRPTDGPTGGLVRHDGGPINSGAFVWRYLISGCDISVAEELTIALDSYAREFGTIFLTSEAFAQLFSTLDTSFLSELERLALDHSMRVAYYVRAQHESLEAAWRQWGFRSEMRPSAYVQLRQQLLSYRATLEGVARLAPHVSFEVRRFPPSTAMGGDTALDDFAQTFLGAPSAVDHGRMRANEGLPLDVVNALRHAPPGWFWDSLHDNRSLKRVKQIFTGVPVKETDRTRRSRDLLHRYCFDRFEPDNVVMARRLSWKDEHLIPRPPDHPAGPIDLSALDDLWDDPRPRDELQPLFIALRAAIDPEHENPDAKAFVVDFFDAHA